LAIAYVDARAVMRRLDAVFEIGNWQTTYREIPEGVVCKLRVRIEGEWCEHEDVGSFSDQPDGGDRLKSAFSDSLKRVAVHLGVARYLYDLPKYWVDFDPVKKQIVRPPQLPAWALPNPPAAKAAPAVARTQAAQPTAAPASPAGAVMGKAAGLLGAVIANPFDSVGGVSCPAHPTSAPDPETAAERAAIEAEGDDPAVTDKNAFARLLDATATGWPEARSWMNAHLPGAAYLPGTRYFDVPPDHRRSLVAELRQKPGGQAC